MKIDASITTNVPTTFKINVGVGDFLDRWSILLIKESKGLDVEEELKNYTKELRPDFQDWGYYLRLFEAINLELWELEDRKRILDDQISKEISSLPNFPSKDAPIGKDENDNIEIIKSDPDNNLLYLKGSIPGSKNTQVVVKESVKNVRKLTMTEKIEKIEKLKKIPEKKKK